ncbi:MAG: RluA family pseudouridine synthase [Bacteroidetes bacterium]|nr:MAG: RluA family pseudouridine synthase [Bacteroidota bacterium]
MIIRVPAPMTLTELLLREFSQASRTSVKKMIAHGNVKVNGLMTTNPITKVVPEDTVEYLRQVLTRSQLKAPYPVVFEDNSLLVVEKPAGLLTVGERGQGGTSIYKEMLDYVKENSEGRERLYVVHRLDREVSGLLVFAKTEVIQQQVKEGWKLNRKLYYALVEGIPDKEKGTIRSWLKEGREQKMFSVRDPGDAKYAVTHYRVLDSTAGYALLEVELETGRKNQIRVHLSESGYPVVGDRKYGADDRFVRRIRLHAYYLAMKHPVTEAPLELKCKMPKGFLVLKPEDEKYK